MLGIAAAGALLLAACGSDNNTTATGGSASSANTSNVQCASGSLTGGGSTAQTNAITAWVKAYLNKCSGANINYQTIGSGAGVTGFENKTLDFAGSDFALSGADVAKANARCAGGQAIDLPMAPGGIALGYNIPGVTDLNLSASTLAKIFTGQITNWNDPAIKADNPSANLPNLGIQTFHRSDSSGTSYNFSNYLANEAKAEWPAGANKNWPATTGQGDKGSALIAGDVKKTPGGIGYFEASFAAQNNLPMAKVGNAGGKFVELTTQNVTNFLGTAKVVGAGNDLALSFDYTNTDPNAYPNMLVTYEIVCTKGNNPATVSLLKNFLAFAASQDGQAVLSQEGYVPLPTALQTKVSSAISAIS